MVSHETEVVEEQLLTEVPTFAHLLSDLPSHNYFSNCITYNILQTMPDQHLQQTEKCEEMAKTSYPSETSGYDCYEFPLGETISAPLLTDQLSPGLPHSMAYNGLPTTTPDQSVQQIVDFQIHFENPAECIPISELFLENTELYNNNEKTLQNQMEDCDKANNELHGKYSEENDDDDDEYNPEFDSDVEESEVEKDTAEENNVEVTNIENTLTKSGKARKRKPKLYSKQQKTENKKRKLINDHPLRPPCNNCRRKCTSKLVADRRVALNEQFWKLDWQARRTFILTSTTRKLVKAHKSENSNRQNTFEYFFTDEQDVRHQVCKTFFLTRYTWFHKK